ncbi:hypothetical protein AAHC03_09134 [Spirometra sp. Aus1]
MLFPPPQRCRLEGADIVLWLICHAGADDISRAVHLGSYISAMGYLFSIDDHVMVVKNDSHTYYRFRLPACEQSGPGLQCKVQGSRSSVSVDTSTLRESPGVR